MIGRILVGVGAALAVAATVVAARRKKAVQPEIAPKQEPMFEFTLCRINHLHSLKQQRAVVNGQHPLNGWYSQVHFSENLKQWVTIAANDTAEAIVVLVANNGGYDVLTYHVPGPKYERALNILTHHTRKGGDVDAIWPELHILALDNAEPRTKWMGDSAAFYYLARLGRGEVAQTA